MTYEVRIVDGDGSGWGGQWDYPDETVEADDPEEALDEIEDWVQVEAAGLDDYMTGDPVMIYLYGEDGYTHQRRVTIDKES